MTAVRRAAEALSQALGPPARRVARAPGRVNVIGDHTDYQQGLVLPMAIDRDTAVAVADRDDTRVRLVSECLAEPVDFDAADPGRALTGWGAYAQGVAWALGEAGMTPGGVDGAVASDVPLGAGLSSSAALELAVALALAPQAPARLGTVGLARLCQRAEVDWVGTSCGIMDQLAVAAGVAGHLLRIDCATLAVTPVPLPAELAVLVLDTGTRRELAASAYNARRRETEEAAAALGVATLRHAGADALATLAEPWRCRARHVVSENARVERFTAALAAGDVEAAGAEMADSHASLRDDFAVVTAELDAIVAAAAEQPGCVGARMTGAGLGGCAVALVRREHAGACADGAARGYAARTGRTARVWTCRPAAGGAHRPAPTGGG